MIVKRVRIDKGDDGNESTAIFSQYNGVEDLVYTRIQMLFTDAAY